MVVFALSASLRSPPPHTVTAPHRPTFSALAHSFSAHAHATPDHWPSRTPHAHAGRAERRRRVLRRGVPPLWRRAMHPVPAHCPPCPARRRCGFGGLTKSWSSWRRRHSVQATVTVSGPPLLIPVVSPPPLRRCPQDDDAPTPRSADAKDDNAMLDGEGRRSSRLQARTLQPRSSCAPRAAPLQSLRNGAAPDPGAFALPAAGGADSDLPRSAAAPVT